MLLREITPSDGQAIEACGNLDIRGIKLLLTALYLDVCPDLRRRHTNHGCVLGLADRRHQVVRAMNLNGGFLPKLQIIHPDSEQVVRIMFPTTAMTVWISLVP